MRCARPETASRGWNRRSTQRCRTGQLAPSATALMALRGIEFIAATTFWRRSAI